MEKKEILEELKAKFDALYKEKTDLETEWKGDFEGTKEYHAYMSYTQDEIKKEMYPDWYEKEQRLKQLDKKVEVFEQELKNSAKNLNAEIVEKISKLEKKLEVNEKTNQKANEEITNMIKQREELQKSDAYKNGDEEVINQVEELSGLIIAKTNFQNKIANKINTYKAEIENLKKQREELIEEYGKDIGKIDSQKPKSVDDKNNPVKDDKKKDKVNQSRGGAGTVVTTTGPELTEEQKAEVERLKKEKEFKEKFTSLCNKMKKGKLEDKDFEDLVAIMNDKENYDKLGITTGLVFNNKARGIFKALRKSAKKDPDKSAKIEEAYSTYKEVFFEKNDDKKINKWSKIFTFDEVENQKALPAPSENTSNQQNSLIDKLSKGVVKPGQENKMPPQPSQSKDQQII